MYYKIVDSIIIGKIYICWHLRNEKPIINRILLNTDKYKIEKFFENSCEEIENIKNKIIDFLNGKDVKFSLDLLNFENLTDFDKKVLFEVFKIPKGKVKTYGDIAKLIGKPKAARAVGNSLRKNPFPLIIPCHRVIKSDGSLGGFQSGIEIKKKLLKMELKQY